MTDDTNWLDQQVAAFIGDAAQDESIDPQSVGKVVPLPRAWPDLLKKLGTTDPKLAGRCIAVAQLVQSAVARFSGLTITPIVPIVVSTACFYNGDNARGDDLYSDPPHLRWWGGIPGHGCGPAHENVPIASYVLADSVPILLPDPKKPGDNDTMTSKRLLASLKQVEQRFDVIGFATSLVQAEDDAARGEILRPFLLKLLSAYLDFKRFPDSNWTTPSMAQLFSAHTRFSSTNGQSALERSPGGGVSWGCSHKPAVSIDSVVKDQLNKKEVFDPADIWNIALELVDIVGFGRTLPDLTMSILQDLLAILKDTIDVTTQLANAHSRLVDATTSVDDSVRDEIKHASDLNRRLALVAAGVATLSLIT